MITTLSLTNASLTVIIDNGAQIIPVRNDNPKWPELIELVKEFDVTPEGKLVGPEDKLLAMLSLKAIVEDYTVGRLSVNATGVTYNGNPIHTVDAERVMAFLRDNLPYKPIANYIERKMKNPSARAINEMYNFLEHKGMPLTPSGTFIAYKGVKPDFYSVRGNKQTVVLQGTVNEEGQILNTVGSVIEVERSSVDDDFRQGCSFGLHAGSLVYARGWGSRVVLVEIDPADVVSVPEDCNCQKLRCCKYKVIGEYTGPMPDTYTDEFEAEDPEEDICHECGAETGTCECDQEEEESCETCGEACEDCPCNTPEDGSDKAEADSEHQGCSCDSEQCKKEDASVPTAGGAEPSEPSETYKKVLAILSEQLGVSESDIKSSTQMSAEILGMDSLDAVELCMAFEEEFGFEIPDEQAEKFINATVGEVVAAIEKELGIEPTLNQVADEVLPKTKETVREQLGMQTIPTDSQGRTEENMTSGDECPVCKYDKFACTCAGGFDTYSKGRAEGVCDRKQDNPPRFLTDDKEGADSPEHAQFIEGYLEGYRTGY